MALICVANTKQVVSELNNGEIIEKRPISFLQEEGVLKPYSNIFYWALIQTLKETTVPEHPHKGFEILTFVLQGEMEHFDNKNKVWRKITSGDVQVIQSGNGVSHTESFAQNSILIQIWLDPDLSKSINKEPCYKDYSSDKFPLKIEKSKSLKIYKGIGAPLQLGTEGIEIKEISLSPGEHKMELNNNKVYSCFIIEGEMVIQNTRLATNDFFMIKRQSKERIEVNVDSRIFLLESPLNTSYKTYAEMHRLDRE